MLKKSIILHNKIVIYNQSTWAKSRESRTDDAYRQYQMSIEEMSSIRKNISRSKDAIGKHAKLQNVCEED